MPVYQKVGVRETMHFESWKSVGRIASNINGSFLDHSKRTERLLLDWGASEELALAGLCHAVYGTDGFATALLNLDQRQRLSVAAGPDVEAVVYFYGSCDRGLLLPSDQLGQRGKI